jgi:hypothetical protein
MPTLHSHTHCQVAQADPQAKTWQRVCLSNRTKDSETHDRQEGQQLTAVAVAQLCFFRFIESNSGLMSPFNF